MPLADLAAARITPAAFPACPRLFILHAHLFV